MSGGRRLALFLRVRALEISPFTDDRKKKAAKFRDFR